MEVVRGATRWKFFLRTSRSFLNQNVLNQTVGQPKFRGQHFRVNPQSFNDYLHLSSWPTKEMRLALSEMREAGHRHDFYAHYYRWVVHKAFTLATVRQSGEFPLEFTRNSLLNNPFKKGSRGLGGLNVR